MICEDSGAEQGHCRLTSDGDDRGYTWPDLSDFWEDRGLLLRKGVKRRTLLEQHLKLKEVKQSNIQSVSQIVGQGESKTVGQSVIQ